MLGPRRQERFGKGAPPVPPMLFHLRPVGRDGRPNVVVAASIGQGARGVAPPPDVASPPQGGANRPPFRARGDAFDSEERSSSTNPPAVRSAIPLAVDDVQQVGPAEARWR
jgi:hypothetical protein